MSLDFLKDVAEFKEFVRALERFREERPRLSLSGVNDAARPYFLAMLAIHAPARIIYIQTSDRPLAELEERCRFFLDKLGVSRNVKALPSLTENPYGGAPPSLEDVASRTRFFYDLKHRPPALILTNLFGLLRPFPGPGRLDGLFVRLERGLAFERDRLLERLAEFGYVREDLLAFRGEYAYRGGVVDAFSPWHPQPFRIEFSGDEIASIREFDPASQRTIRKIERCVIPALVETVDEEETVPYTAYLGDAVLIVESPENVEREYKDVMEEIRELAAAAAASGQTVRPPEHYFPPALWSTIRSRAIRAGELAPEETRGDFHFGFQSVPRFDNRIAFFLSYMKKLQEERERCLIFLSTATMRSKVMGLLAQESVPARAVDSALERAGSGEILLALGDLERGFAYAREKAAVFGETDILTEERIVAARPSAKPSITQFQDLKAGDFVVHADYGVGLFHGLVRMDVDGQAHEFLELCYRDDDRLLVPVEDLNRLQKFTPVGTGSPALDKLGTTGWEKTKAKTRKAVEKLAKELLDLYARRKSVPGFAFSPEGAWQEEFEKTFEYEETEDQLRSIREIKADMESGAPMDRLLCGDVGYGKTEVAMRAAFKAVMDGKQVAVLCPTTVLASQHYKTFAARLALHPVRVAALTRFQGRAEQVQILKDLKDGQLDILIGTHRILSKDVEFRDLGLLVIDEEQRFGVHHKEKIKQMKTVDAAQGPPGRPYRGHDLQSPAHRLGRQARAGPGRAGLLRPQPHRGHGCPGGPDRRVDAPGPGGHPARPDGPGRAGKAHARFHRTAL